MIFDLLTLKDPFNRWRIYPNSELQNIFVVNDGHVSSYEIEDGWYFGRNKTWWGVANWFWLNYENLLTYGEKREVNTIVFEYRSNHSFTVTTDSTTEHVEEHFAASETFKRGSVKFEHTIEHYDLDTRVLFKQDVHEEDTSVHKGDYLIIRKFEFLTV